MECVWTPGITLELMEKMVIQKALVVYEYNKVRTSKALGITPQTLRTKLEIYEVEAQKVKEAENELIRKDKEFAARERTVNIFDEGGATLAKAADDDRLKARAAEDARDREVADNVRKREEYLKLNPPKPKVRSGEQPGYFERKKTGAGHDASSEASVESAKDSSPQHAVPVSKREQVQEVLPSKASPNRTSKRS